MLKIAGEPNRLVSFSQSGQDLSAVRWMMVCGFLNRVAVEFGARDGFRGSNVRMLKRQLGFKLFQWDRDFESGQVCRETVNAENANEVFRRRKVPRRFDFLSIDIDGNDYWVWKSLSHEPNVVCIECNTNLPPNVPVALAYSPQNSWKGDVGYGASFAAYKKLGESKGYHLCEVVFNDLVFVRREFLSEAQLSSKVVPNYPIKMHRQEGYDRFVPV